jgi:hypothetical protein
MNERESEGEKERERQRDREREREREWGREREYSYISRTGPTAWSLRSVRVPIFPIYSTCDLKVHLYLIFLTKIMSSYWRDGPWALC